MIDANSENISEVIYKKLYDCYGPRGWWPVTPGGGVSPSYDGGPRSERQRFEVCVGAVLTQNTAWKNAAAAIRNLNRVHALAPGKLKQMEQGEIARLIKPAGYYNQKANRLKIMANFFSGVEKVSRESLLELNGIGPETADSILLYAYNKPYFVVDAYTRRIFSRIGFIVGDETYREIQTLFQRNLPRSVPLYQEYHALIVEHGKCHCRRNPRCDGCVLISLCRYRRGDGGD